MAPAALVLILVQFVLVATCVAATGPESLSFVVPEDKSVIEGEWLSVVVKSGERNVDSVSISVNGKDIARLPLVPSRPFFCKTVRVKLGLNTVTVKAVRNDKSVVTGSITVFRKSDISQEASTVPDNYRSRPFHQKGKESDCSGCHITEPSEKDLSPDTPKASPCYQCHRQVTAHSHVHGPAATWSCLSCHLRNSQPTRYTIQKPEQDACYACHVDEKKQWATKQFVHGPTATGKCSICHNPHSSDNPYVLRKSTWDLCVSCHDERVHNTGSFAFLGKNHPTRGTYDPRRPGHVLTCASCHDPHAADSDTLFTFEAKDVFELCANCHPKK